MIVDACMWFREIDMLELRLRALDDLVDVFVVGEADRTFQGEPKGLVLPEFRRRLGPWWSRIVHWPVRLPEGAVTWEAERLQREGLKDGVASLGPHDESLVVFADVDEVWWVEMPPAWEDGITVARHDFRKMSVFWRWGAPFSWPGAIGGRWCDMRDISWQQLRDRRWELPHRQSGWHFSWMGEPEDLQAKANSFSHHEYRNLPFADMTATGTWTDGALGRTDEMPPFELGWLPQSWFRR